MTINANERLAEFLRDIGFDAGLVELGGAVNVKLAGQGRFALVTAGGVDPNVWHVVATGFTQVCVGAYALWVTLVGLGAYYGSPDEGQAKTLVWNQRWLKVDRLVSAFHAEGEEPGTLSKPTRRMFDWLVTEEP